MMTSASGADFEKAVNNLDLISGDQGWCVAAVLRDECRGITISAQHTLEYVFRQKVGLFASDHQYGDVNGVPILPEVHAIVPGITKRVRDVRIAQQLIAVAFGLPFHAMDRQMTPMFVFQFARTAPRRDERYSSAASMVSKLFGASLRLAPRRSNPGPRQIRSNIVDHDAADRAARQCRENHANQAAQ